MGRGDTDESFQQDAFALLAKAICGDSRPTEKSGGALAARRRRFFVPGCGWEELGSVVPGSA
jgi:hypothetical protein